MRKFIELEYYRSTENYKDFVLLDPEDIDLVYVDCKQEYADRTNDNRYFIVMKNNRTFSLTTNGSKTLQKYLKILV